MKAKAVSLPSMIVVLAIFLVGLVVGQMSTFFFIPDWIGNMMTNFASDKEMSYGDVCADYEVMVDVASDVFPEGSFTEMLWDDPDEAIYKWRYHQGKPYVEFPANAGFEIVLSNEFDKWLKVYTDDLTEKLSNKFVYSRENEVPYYVYPGGGKAIKSGFTTSSGTNYLVGLFEERDRVAFDEDGEPMFDANNQLIVKPQVVLRVLCGGAEADNVSFYDDYFDTHEGKALPGEAVVSYDPYLLGEDSKMKMVYVKYPGTPVWGYARELWYKDDASLTRISVNSPQPNCVDLDAQFDEEHFLCFDSTRKQFRMSR